MRIGFKENIHQERGKKMKKEIQIGKHKISRENKAYIIAEMSGNHNMDFEWRNGLFAFQHIFYFAVTYINEFY